MNAIVTMVEGASVIILAVLCCAAFGDRYRESVVRSGIIYGIVFAVTGFIIMMTPIELIEGVRTDPRNAVASLSAAIGGPISAVITAGVLITVRYSFGGIGALPGSAGIAAGALASTLLWAWWRYRIRKPFSYSYISWHAVIALTIPTFTIYALSAAPPDVFRKSASLFAPTNFLAVLLIGGLIVREQTRRREIAEKEEIKARLGGVANNAPIMLFQLIVDENDALVFPYVSEGCRSILEVPPASLMNDPVILQQILQRSSYEQLRSVLKKSAQDFKRWSFDTEFQQSDGQTIWVRMIAKPRMNKENRLIWDGSLSDISAQHRSEIIKKEFVATVSHELRTPLTSINGALQLALGGAAGEVPAPLHRLLWIAGGNAERLKRLVDDILDMEKIESGNMTFDMKTQEIAPLIQSAIEANEAYLAESEVKMVFENDTPGATAIIDADRFAQVMANLLSNAIKFSPAKGKITLRLDPAGENWRVSVADEGPGIPPQYRSRIFDKFEQVDTSDARAKGGTGLGLSISKALIERMNGTIGFDTVEGAGTKFYFELPQSLPIEADMPITHEEATASRHVA
ncbi:ATP-binding protein [Notoacmeibacter ruber]|uniref:histidine kinase n=1 Tax=Notoacmeibacter ruber TaxID=2670375 RepID=A0A3L7JC32_9HYPH|nr:ATP-binding protein [Notoacmeibacter ruber]RLQ87101.1 hypothetical protein D8780_01610 [Notoacmeibacter ruber]